MQRLRHVCGHMSGEPGHFLFRRQEDGGTDLGQCGDGGKFQEKASGGIFLIGSSLLVFPTQY